MDAFIISCSYYLSIGSVVEIGEVFHWSTSKEPLDLACFNSESAHAGMIEEQ